MRKYSFLLIIFIGFFCYLMSFPSEKISNLIPKTIEVEVKGAVKNPGIFQIQYQSTMEELLKEVQLTDKADINSINLQTIIHHKDVIMIPELKSYPKISINVATLEELILLNGIGEKTAQNIISYREEHGLFQTIEDLLFVPGIGLQKLNKIRDYISL